MIFETNIWVEVGGWVVGVESRPSVDVKGALFSSSQVTFGQQWLAPPLLCCKLQMAEEGRDRRDWRRDGSMKWHTRTIFFLQFYKVQYKSLRPCCYVVAQFPLQRFPPCDGFRRPQAQNIWILKKKKYKLSAGFSCRDKSSSRLNSLGCCASSNLY